MAKTIGLEIDLPELANLTPSDLIALSGGGYVVSFAGYRGPNDTSGRTAFAVLDDQGGVVAGPSTVTNRSQGGDGYESLLALSNGGFAITWVGNQGLAGQSPQLYMRFFDATGTAASKRITIDSELKSSLVAEPVLLETPGGVRVAFVESDDFFFNLNTADIAPGGRVSNREVIDIGAVPGTPQGEILDNGKAVYALNAGIGGIARVETRANGDFIGDDRIDMILDSYSFRNTAGDPVIAELASGDYIIAWSGGGREVGSYAAAGGIWGQRFDANGDMIGMRYLLSDTNDARSPDLVALDSGGFLLSWSERDDNFSGFNAPSISHAREFGVTGRPIGREITLPSDTGHNLNTKAHIAVQDDGTALAVMSVGGDGYREAIARRIDLADLGDFAGAISGNDRDNTLLGTAADDIIYGERGNDTLTGRSGHDNLFGGRGKDILTGGNGIDMLDGGLGNDVLKGGKGADVLVAGTGRDRMIGGGGADTFVFHEGTVGHHAVIMDFKQGVDALWITGYDPGGSPYLSQTLTSGGLLVEWNITNPAEPDCSIFLRGVDQTLGFADILTF